MIAPIIKTIIIVIIIKIPIDNKYSLERLSALIEVLLCFLLRVVVF